MRISIIHEDDDILVIDKPAGLPSAPLKRTIVNLPAKGGNAMPRCQDMGAPSQQATSTLEQAAELFPALRAVAGYAAWEFGLIHRLDTATRGLLLIAKNQQAFDFLRQEQTNGRISKHYRAFCVHAGAALSNCPALPRPLALQLERLFSEQTDTQALICTSRFRPWGKGGKEVRPFVSPQTHRDFQNTHKKTYAEKKSGKKEYATSLSISAISTEKTINSIKKYTAIQENLSLVTQNKTVYSVDCELTRGYRHQVRVHLAWCALPIIGDELYGCIKAPPLLFFADKIKFTHPASRKPVEFSFVPPCSP